MPGPNFFTHSTNCSAPDYHDKSEEGKLPKKNASNYDNMLETRHCINMHSKYDKNTGKSIT